MLTALSVLSVTLLLITAFSLHRWLVTRQELHALVLYLHKKEIQIDPETLYECVQEVVR